jgi:hypothetical protein
MLGAAAKKMNYLANIQSSLRAKRSNPVPGQGASASITATPVAPIRGADQRQHRGEAGLLRFSRNDGKRVSHARRFAQAEEPCAA